MTNQEHFNRSVLVLVKAFFEGILAATECAACACGNLVAAANNYSIIDTKAEGLIWLDASGEEVQMCWQDLVWHFRHGHHVSPIDAEFAMAQIMPTGYSAKQFAEIEEAFMDGACPYSPTCPSQRLDEVTANFNGLMALVDKLADIHKVDLTTAEAAKSLFVKQAA
jgi:hypothetical protein